MKYYILHWLDGTNTYITGESIEDAFNKSGYTNGAIAALDYYEQAKELPLEYKQLIVNNNMIPNDGWFGRQVLEQIKKGLDMVSVTLGKSKYSYKVTIKPFKIILKKQTKYRLYDCYEGKERVATGTVVIIVIKELQDKVSGRVII